MKDGIQDESRRPRVRYFFIFSILLFVYIGILTGVAWPYAKANFLKFRLKEHYELFKMEEAGIMSEPLTLVFYSPTGPVKVERSVRTHDEDYLHLILEALLKGPDENALRLGYVSYIPEGTRLIGASEINGIVFADFSSEIEKSPYLSAALEEIKETLTQTGKYYEVHILSSGKEIQDLI